MQKVDLGISSIPCPQPGLQDETMQMYAYWEMKMDGDLQKFQNTAEEHRPHGCEIEGTLVPKLPMVVEGRPQVQKEGLQLSGPARASCQ